jgi:hypothetical protein
MKTRRFFVVTWIEMEIRTRRWRKTSWILPLVSDLLLLKTENKSVKFFLFFSGLILLLRSFFFSTSILSVIVWIRHSQWRICAWIAEKAVQWWWFMLESLRTVKDSSNLLWIVVSGDLGFRIGDEFLGFFVFLIVTVKREKVWFCFCDFDELAKSEWNCDDWILYIADMCTTGPIETWHLCLDLNRLGLAEFLALGTSLQFLELWD